MTERSWVQSWGKRFHAEKSKRKCFVQCTPYRSARNRKTENSWLLVPYSIKANRFCELRRQKIQTYEPCSSQKWFAKFFIHKLFVINKRPKLFPEHTVYKFFKVLKSELIPYTSYYFSKGKKKQIVKNTLSISLRSSGEKRVWTFVAYNKSM